MANYLSVYSDVKAATAANAPQVFAARVIPALIDIWLRNSEGLSDDIVETTPANFSYLFDIGSERLIAAWGLSAGRVGRARFLPNAIFPQSAGQIYHRGHAIAHRLGGALDINLVPQLGRINSGPFLELEKRAIATPGALYFTFWTYRGPGPDAGRGSIRACSFPVRFRTLQSSEIEGVSWPQSVYRRPGGPLILPARFHFRHAVFLLNVKLPVCLGSN